MRQNSGAAPSAHIFQYELSVFLKVCEAVNTPRAVACYILASEGEWTQYIGLPMPDPLSPTFADDYLVSEAMRKNPHLNTAIDTERVALDKWHAAEEDCARTNELLLAYQEGLISFSPATETLITKTQRIIADVLGPLTRSKLEYAEANFRFGPGATLSCSGAEVVPSRKMLTEMSVTQSLLSYYRVLQPAGWRHLNTHKKYCVVPGNRVTFVPKDAKTDRAIAVEPHMNIYVQLGIGALLRRQLRLAGLDLDVGADVNRRMAQRAFRDGDATIDLSSASDTIAFQLVGLLLPIEWFQLLCLARSERSLLPCGRSVELDKFSAMGCGFTFELESLIFWALARACSDYGATPVVFGDDIICPRTAAAKLIPLLNTLGFSVNERKTYLAGTFFESCGADYWHGVNIRPFYFKGVYADTTSAVIRVANKIRLYAHRRGFNAYCDARFLKPWLFAIKRDSKARATGIPAGAGDDGLIRNFDEATPSKARHGWQGYYSAVWRCKPVRSRNTIERGAYLCALAWGTNPLTSRTIENMRGRVGRGQLVRQLLFEWPDLGPWA